MTTESLTTMTEPLRLLTDEEILRIAAKTIKPYETYGIALGEYEEETQSAVEAYGSELIAFARAIAAELEALPND